MSIRIDPTPQTRIRAYARDFPLMSPADIALALRRNFQMNVPTADVKAALEVKDRRRIKSVAPGAQS